MKQDAQLRQMRNGAQEVSRLESDILLFDGRLTGSSNVITRVCEAVVERTPVGLERMRETLSTDAETARVSVV